MTCKQDKPTFGFSVMSQVRHKYEAAMSTTRMDNTAVNHALSLHRLAHIVERSRQVVADDAKQEKRRG